MDRIAIVGIGGVFPNVATPSSDNSGLSDDLAEFWRVIQTGVDCSREVPNDRWILDKEEVWGDHVQIDKVNATRGCFVDMDVLAQSSSEFADLEVDTQFLAKLDPMFHLLLRAGQQAWKDTQGKKQLDKKKVGVIVGNIVLPTDASSALADELLGNSMLSQWLSIESTTRTKTESLNRYVAGLPAGLLAKALGLGGGSYTLDAACASSLYALKYAVDELLSGRADAMLTGGLSRPDSLYTQMGFSALGAISETGRCSPFDEKADGLLVGEGCGVLVLKRLTDAVRDKDHIYATIAGIGLSNDIAGNLMSPDSEGQLRAIHAAYNQAGWLPDDVDLIECHGTGTPVGDGVELQSLRSFWSQKLVDDQQHCVMGSVKGNIGHLLTAAGSAGLIKVLLAMKHQQLPPTANFERAAGGSVEPFRILNKAEEWQQRDGKTPRRAAVSAFGFGGINAHVLLEEYRTDAKEFSVAYKTAKKDIANTDIAIVGMETYFGSWGSLDAFKQRCLSEEQSQAQKIANHWWGVDNPTKISGWCIEDLKIPIGRYRIPPNELKEMLPQQLLMLEVAANALQDAGIVEQLVKEVGEKTGVFIGIGLDLNTTNFHLRWSFKRQVAEWCAQQEENSTGQVDPKILERWRHSVLDAISPSLNANRTMGSLGGIVASRIARVFEMGGPSFTISSEESSGLKALQVAVHALQKDELDMAVVGAVDFSGDVRAALAQNVHRAYSEHTQLGEGAVAFVLKRYADAQRDGDKVYSIIKGSGVANGGEVDDIIPTERVYQRAFNAACVEAKVKLSDIGLIEAHGSGYAEEDAMEAEALVSLFKKMHVQKTHGDLPCVLSSVKSEIGHTGAASGLASLARASLCLYHRIWPRFVQQSPLFLKLLQNFDHDRLVMLMQPQRWLNGGIGRNRLAAVNGFSVDGNCISVILAAAESPVENTNLSQSKTILFEFYAETSIALLEQLQLFARQMKKNILPVLAQNWHKNQNLKQKHFSAAIVTDDPKHLEKSLDELRQAIEKSQLINSNGVYFSPQNSETVGKLGFVYPGLGNDFPRMEQQISQQWPAVFERFNLDSDPLLTEAVKTLFWKEKSAEDSVDDYSKKIIRQIWSNSLVHDVFKQFNVKPSAILGYSLGESSGLVATRVWKDRNDLVQAMSNTDLFTNGLTGAYDCVRNSWQLHASEQVDWATYIVNASAHEIKKNLIAGLDSYFRVYLLIINTPNECVIGGDKKATIQFLQELAKPYSEISNLPAIHCEIVEQVKDDYRALHLFSTHPIKGVDFYSVALGKHYVVTRESAADAITSQAIQMANYNAMIESAYADGVRLFIELGPGSSCTRMISNILGDRQHIARSICVRDQDNVKNMLLCLGQLIAEHIPINSNILYESRSVAQQKRFSVIHISIGGSSLHIPDLTKLVAKDPSSAPKSSDVKSVAKDPSSAPKSSDVKSAAKNLSSAPKSSDVKSVAKDPSSAAKGSDVKSVVKDPSSAPKSSDVKSVVKDPSSAPKSSDVKSAAKDPSSAPKSSDVKSVVKDPSSAPKGSDVKSVAKDPSSASKGSDVKSVAKDPSSAPKGSDVKSAAKDPSSTPKSSDVKSAAKDPSSAPKGSDVKSVAKDPSSAPKGSDVQSVVVAKKQSDALTRLIAQMQSTEIAKVDTQSAFLSVSNSIIKTLTVALELEATLKQNLPPSAVEENSAPSDQLVLFDRETCMRIATGSIGEVLGEKFSDIDQYPSRVRLPAEPLMLVDRIISIEGEEDSISHDLQTHGSIITEHDVLPQSWYLDGNHIPICMAVEAGQADLFLAGYLGIDHITLGTAFYRLLDAQVVFHDNLPEAGQTIRYHIHIEHFFKQNETYLFHFNFEATVNEKPLMSMMQGCAGFFTTAQLDAGKGIVQTGLEISKQEGKIAEDWLAFVPMQLESYSDAQLNALRQGDLVACFGEKFANLPLVHPMGLPSGKMTLVDRILNLDPHGGRFGIGQITGESDIHSDDWFLTCHFSDDPVMPGTLMYECCLHTLRVYLLRIGWVGEQDAFTYQPIIGISSQLKCRGQVIASTTKIQYQITLKELGYQDDGTPYVLADALIYSDHKAIVQMDNMSAQLNGLKHQKIIDYWKNISVDKTPDKTIDKNILFDTASIYAFAAGKPSDAFGDRYKIFDESRQIARLPKPPYQFLDRIVAIEACQAWKLEVGGKIVAEYDVLQDAWYFAQNRQAYMPFAILLEIALQPCGWLAAYLGSALTSEDDLSFRNLGGTGTQYIAVQPEMGTLSTHIEITKVVKSGNMIIQDYNLSVYSGEDLVYQGDTQFGFFSKEALVDQVGIRDADLYQPDTDSCERSFSFPYPSDPPYPDQMLRMVEDITIFDPKGGPHGLGFIRGTSSVDAKAWFFDAHFYQDPVCPGSLGLESFIQLLKVFATAKWSRQKDLSLQKFEAVALQQKHQWLYRGQIVPKDTKITIEAVITHLNNKQKLIRADGFLSIDGRIIYKMTDFTLRILK